MRPDPAEKLDPRAIWLWRIYGLFPGLFLAALAGAGVVGLSDSLRYAAAAAAAAYLVVTLFTAVIRPTYLARTWRYEITPDELYLQRGFLVVRRTVVPLVRVENVDTAQGPLASALGIMSLAVSTAAGTHEIPALPAESAEALRDQIARWAREARDDS